MRLTVRLLVVLTVLATTLAAGKEEILTVFDQRKVTLNVPEGFTLERANDSPGGIVAVRLSGPKGTLDLNLFFAPDPTGGELVKSARSRKEFMVREFQDLVEASTERAMQFEEFGDRGGSAGTYCAFTDSTLLGKPQLPPNEFLHITVGVRAWPAGCVLFKLFSNDLISAEYRVLIDFLRDGIRLIPLTPLK